VEEAFLLESSVWAHSKVNASKKNGKHHSINSHNGIGKCRNIPIVSDEQLYDTDTAIMKTTNYHSGLALPTGQCSIYWDQTYVHSKCTTFCHDRTINGVISTEINEDNLSLTVSALSSATHPCKYTWVHFQH